MAFWGKKRLVIVLVALLWPSLTAVAVAEEPVSIPSLHLNQAIRIALENNLNLRAEELDTRASQALVRKGYGLYDPRLQLNLVAGTSRQQINQLFISDPNQPFFSDEVRDKYRLFDFSVAQTFPTGAQLLLSLDNRYSDLDPAPDINPSYDSEVRFSLIQPLLKGFGSTVTEQAILFAIKDREVAVSNLREVATNLLVDVRNNYFEVLRLQENLDFWKTSVALAKKILDEARARVDAGVLPPVDILEAKFGLKDRQRQQLDAERALQDGLDNLALLLGTRKPITVAGQKLGRPKLNVDAERAFAAALIKRPELQRRLRQIESLELEKRLSRNALLPQLDLSATYSHSGLGHDYSDNLQEMGSGDFPSWEVGLFLSYPLGNRLAENEYRRVLLRLRGERARIAQFKEEIRNEIRAAIRLLDVSQQKIEVTASGLEFAEEKLRILLKRQEVGLATTRQVLEGEEDLAAAQIQWVEALADYNKAVTLYYQVTGCLLESAQIRFAGDLEDESSPLLQLEKL